MASSEDRQTKPIVALEHEDDHVVVDRTTSLYSNDISAWYRGILEDSKQLSKGQFIFQRLVDEGLIVSGKEAAVRDLIHSEAPELFSGAVVAEQKSTKKWATPRPNVHPREKKRDQWSDRDKSLGEDPGQFVDRVYADLADGQLHTGILQRNDRVLAVTYTRWAAKTPSEELQARPNHPLPTSDEWKSRHEQPLTPEQLSQAQRQLGRAARRKHLAR